MEWLFIKSNRLDSEREQDDLDNFCDFAGFMVFGPGHFLHFRWTHPPLVVLLTAPLVAVSADQTMQDVQKALKDRGVDPGAIDVPGRRRS